MKIKRYNQLNEDTWDLPKNQKEGIKYIKELTNFRNKIYNVFGNSEILNNIDNAIIGMEELLKDVPL